MQELIWYVECYGNWVAGGFIVGYLMGTYAALCAAINIEKRRLEDGVKE